MLRVSRCFRRSGQAGRRKSRGNICEAKWKYHIRFQCVVVQLKKTMPKRDKKTLEIYKLSYKSNATLRCNFFGSSFVFQGKSCWTLWPTHGTSSSVTFCPCCWPSSIPFRYLTHSIVFSDRTGIGSQVLVCSLGERAISASAGSAPL